MADVSSLLPLHVQKNLLDKLYEKRKSAALEVEATVKQFIALGDSQKVLSLIDFLIDEYALSPQASHRKGGLIGLAAATVGLASDAAPYLKKIVPPIINAFSDQDSRVRFYACEALYNIAKVAREDIIFFITPIFDSLCKLSADTDPTVQSAAHLLDRLIKDIATESNRFSVEEFIPLLRQRMNVLNTYVRQFLLGWITALDNVPEIDMLGFLPDFLDGLFNMLSDLSYETRQTADAALAEFLREIKSSQSVDYGRIFGILVKCAASSDSFTRLTSISWMNELVKSLRSQLSPYYPDILGSVLSAISDKEEKIRVIAEETNAELRTIEVSFEQGFDIGAVVSVTQGNVFNEWADSRIEALRWLMLLLERHHAEVILYLDDVLPALLQSFSDTSDEFVLLSLEVFACIAREASHFNHCIVMLLQNFQNHRSLLGNRGNFIVRKLCNLLSAENVYREFSTILEGVDDLAFARIMIEQLNLILFTEPELRQLRLLLEQSSTCLAGSALFEVLYRSWCHSPVATISLCLLIQAFEHSSMVIQRIDEQDIDANFMDQLDKLVRLLETPIFTRLKIKLLQPQQHFWLIKSLYGLLLLLPQKTQAFNILKTRLKTFPASICNRETVEPFYSSAQTSEDPFYGIDFSAKLHQFCEIQKHHRLKGSVRVKL